MNASIPQSSISLSLGLSDQFCVLNLSFLTEKQELKIKTLKFYRRLQNPVLTFTLYAKRNKDEFPGTVGLNWLCPTNGHLVTSA